MMLRKPHDHDEDQAAAEVQVWSRAKHPICLAGKPNIHARLADAIMQTWEKVVPGSTDIGVSTGHTRDTPGYRTDVSEVTKADRDSRKRYIDDLVKMLVDDGMSGTKAKQKATERYDEDHPWFKQSSRGKV